MFTGIDHLAVFSPEPKRLADWYIASLHFKLAYESSGNFFIQSVDGNLLEISPAEGSTISVPAKTPGFRHLAIAVDDFAAAYQHLQSHAVSFAGEPYESQGNKIVFFHDADGNLLHLVQRARPVK